MFSELHWIPSAIAAILTIVIVLVKGKTAHKALGYAIALFAIMGLAGFVLQGDFHLFNPDIVSFHAWLGAAALIVALVNVATARELNKRHPERKKRAAMHHTIGYVAAGLSLAAILMGFFILGSTMSLSSKGATQTANMSLQVPASNVLSNVEATEFMGIGLTPMSEQGNNAINGTQYVNESSYRLRVTGE